MQADKTHADAMQISDPAPIALFAFRRPEHTRRALDALRANERAGHSRLYVFCDAPRNPAEADLVRDVRDIVRRVEGFASVHPILRETNLGLAGSIISGVDYVLQRHGRVIVVEDDIVTSRHFLTYMNDALDLYAEDERVASIHGYVYPVAQALPETFFLRGADCWGWATWSRAWTVFDADAARLLNELESRRMLESFDLEGRFSFSDMLRQFIAGENNSWAIRWHASCYLAGLLTLYPGRSLVQNIGIDASGTHCVDSDVFTTDLAAEPLRVGGIDVREDNEARNAFGDYLKGLAAPAAASRPLEDVEPAKRSILARVTRRLGLQVGRY